MEKSFTEEYWKFVKQKCRGYDIENQKPIFEKHLKEITSYLDLNNKNIRILDIGCGFGYFLRVCEEKTCWKLYGIDISEHAIKEARKILKTAKLEVVNVDENLPFNDNYFDLISMFDVIEHVKSPFNVLKECYRVLKPSGLICITTPNLNAIERLWKRDKWHGFNDPTHIYLFTPDSLKFLVERVGFKVEVLKTPFHPLPEFLSKIASKMFKKSGQIFLIGRKEYE